MKETIYLCDRCGDEYEKADLIVLQHVDLDNKGKHYLCSECYRKSFPKRIENKPFDGDIQTSLYR